MTSYPAATGRPLPWSIEAEEATLGSLMIDNSGIAEIPFLKPEMFYREKHQVIMDALLRLFQRAEPFDPVTVSEELERTGNIDAAGGPAAVTELFMRVPTAIHLQFYARIVERKYILRRAVGAAEKIARLAYEEEATELGELLGKMEAEVFAVSQLRSTYVFPQALGQLVRPAQERYESLHLGASPAGIPTASGDLNRLLTGGGYQRKKMVVLAARPKMGKTTRVLWDMWHQAKAGYIVLFFSMEMDADSVADKLVAMGANVDSARITNGPITAEEFYRVSQYTARTAEGEFGELIICDQRHLSPVAMEGIIRWTIKRYGRVDVIVADHLGEMGEDGLASSKRRASTNDVVAEKARYFRNILGRYNAAGVLVSQLNREVDKREDKHPTLSDLRDSGGIEETADTVIFLYRDEYYHKNTEKPGIAEMVVAAQRGGRTGIVDQYVDLPTGRWGDVARPHQTAVAPPSSAKVLPHPAMSRFAPPLPPPHYEYDDISF